MNKKILEKIIKKKKIDTPCIVCGCDEIYINESLNKNPQRFKPICKNCGEETYFKCNHCHTENSVNDVIIELNYLIIDSVFLMYYCPECFEYIGYSNNEEEWD